jgi:sterol desaturase/sphingolipid hydroxylase (fatty acid hydroxylase superfamily)
MSADQLLALEGPLRLAAFVLIGLLLWSLQRRFALRAEGRADRRLLRNLGLVLIDSLLLRLAFPLLAVALAVDVEARSGGLFGWLAWPPWIEFLAALLLLDLAIYWQHRLFHRIPLFWRLHRVHHSDVAFDVSTGVRFHPLEIAASMLVKLGLVVVLGPPALAVLLFELLLSLGSLFTHSDFALPQRFDRRLRWLLVTPSMHRIHHSTWRPETDSNYGFHLSIWDRLFRSYRTAPRAAEATMPIGLEQFRQPADQTLLQLLVQPLRSPRPLQTPIPERR